MLLDFNEILTPFSTQQELSNGTKKMKIGSYLADILTLNYFFNIAFPSSAGNAKWAVPEFGRLAHLDNNSKFKTLQRLVLEIW